MSLLINDLDKNDQLDAQAMTQVRGGMAIFANKQAHHFGPGPKGHGPAVILPGHLFNKKSLTNVSNQLNIVVNSQNVSQTNSNTVFQF
ncbi:hypothetical protein [Marinobacterium aestuariivivens]|uniref:Uncharacterized protein n=1 Tax=Marinobacterium aestuariivivens TaxID=1698799 RepID=A0ABW2A7H7_9GAMM